MPFSKGAIIGGVIGLIGGLIGMAAAIAVAPVEGTIFSVIFIAIFGGTFWFFLKPFYDQNQVTKNGLDGTAKVIDIWDTGITINYNPEVGLLLEVTPKDGSPSFKTKTTQLVSRINPNVFSVGSMLNVKYDPKSQKVAIVD